MRKILFFKRLKENVRAGWVNLACVFMIVLLTGACAGTYKKQTSSYYDQEIVCREIRFTGSRMKKKVCAPKADWAARDKKYRKKTEEWLDDVMDVSAIHVPDMDSSGGQSSGMPR